MSGAKVNITLTDSIGRVADAITSVVSVIAKYYGDADKRRVTKAIRTGDKIVKRLHELNVLDKKLNKLIDKWDKYNN